MPSTADSDITTVPGSKPTERYKYKLYLTLVEILI